MKIDLYHSLRMLTAVMTFMAVHTVMASALVTSVSAQQRYPWNGLVDIVVTLQCNADDANIYNCTFAATNTATQEGVAIATINRVGGDLISGNVCTRRFLWNAAADVGEVKIDDVALTVGVKILGVQLWENGPYWAECNVGASKPEESGYYFWWGGTVGYERNAGNNGWVSVEDETSFSFSSGNCPTYGKSNSQLQAEGYIDSAGNLVAAHDAAAANLGAPWRMPSDAEFSALVSNCTTSWITTNGVYGRLVTGKGAYSSKNIFLPAAGTGSDASLWSVGSFGICWSSTPNEGIPYTRGRYLSFNSNRFDQGYGYYRCDALSVRPLRGSSSVAGCVSDAAVMVNMKLDCRAGVRLPLDEGETLWYDASWYKNGYEVHIIEDGVLVAEGSSGSYIWRPVSDSSATRTLKLEIVSAEGRVVGTETAQFALGYIRNVTARQLWPHKKIEVSYTLADDIGDAVKDGEELILSLGTSTNQLLATAQRVLGDTSCTPGLHRVVWDMEADGVSLGAEDAQFSVCYLSNDEIKWYAELSHASWIGMDAVPSIWRSSEGNVLSGLSGEFIGNRYVEASRISASDPVSILTDGMVNPAGNSFGNTYGIVNGTLTWTWDEPVSLAMLRINTHWSDGARDGVCLNSVKVLRSGASDWQSLSDSAVTYGWDSFMNSTTGDQELVYQGSSGIPFAENVVGICFDFGAQEANGSGFTEIEAVRAVPYIQGVSNTTALDLSEDVFDGMMVGSMLTLAYTPIDSDLVAIDINGHEVVSSTDSGIYEWSPERPGTYVLEHRVGEMVFTRKVVYLVADDAKEVEIGWLDEAIAISSIYASVTNVVIAPTVTRLPEGTFAGCVGLGDGVVIRDGCVLCVNGECPAHVVIPEGVRLIADGAFRNCSGMESVTFPSTLKYIGANAFRGCTNLELVELPEGLEEVGDEAFRDCTWVQDVAFPPTLTKIGNLAFANCSMLGGIACFDGLDTIGEGAFSNCWRMLSVTLPATVDAIGERAFYNCKSITGVTIPAHVETVADLFPAVYASLESIVIAEGETELIANIFKDCQKVEEIELPDEIEEIPDSAFEWCALLRQIRLPANLIRIGNRAFYGCGQIHELALPDGLEEIGDDAFNGLQQVQGLKCPASVRTIGARAFKGVWNDVGVELSAGLESLGVDAFANCSSIRQISLPAVTTPIKSAFSAAYTQINFVKILGAPEVIPKNFCRDVAQLTGVQIPSSVTNIGEYAFAGLSNLAVIELPPNLRTIGQYAFNGDGRLVTIALPQSVETVGYRAFGGCSNVRVVSCSGELGTLSTLFPSAYSQITTVSINAGTFRLMDDLMSGCSKLSEIDLPAGVTNIGARVFKNCTSLASFGVPNGVVELGADAFYGCTGLTSLALPEGLTAIPSGAFRNCSALTSLVIPASVTFIGEDAFNGCSALMSISYLGSCPEFDSGCYNGTPAGLTSYVVSGSRGWDGVATSKALPENWPTSNARAITYWTPNTFEATFDGNGGAPSSSVVVQTTGMTYVLPEEDPELLGARFNGWWTQPVNGGQIKTTTKVTVVGVQTFYAHWKCNGYAVRFDANGGLGEMEDQLMTVNTATELAMNRFMRKDCRFAGWALSTDGAVEYADGAAVENLSLEQGAVVTLYAVWEEQAWTAAEYLNVPGCAFTFEGDADWIADDAVSHDGIGSMRSGAIAQAEEGLRTTSVMRTTVIGEGAGSFWWKVDCEPSVEGEYYDYCSFTVDGVEVDKIAGKAEWTKVDYEVTGAGEHVLAWTFTRDDWDEDESLYANAAWVDEFKWTPTPVTLSFDAGGAEGEAPLPVTKSAGCEIVMPSPSLLRKSGMVFVGWSDGANVFSPGDVYVFGAADVMLTALWEEKVWTLAEAANLTNLTLTTGGGAAWVVDLVTNYDGVASIRSGIIGDSQESWVSLAVNGAGTVCFRTTVSGEYNRGKLCDYLKFEVDGTSQFTSYNADWSNIVVIVEGTGSHTLKWTYLKNASKSVGDDGAWLDEIVWTPSAAPADPIPDIGDNPTAAEVAAAVAGAADPKVTANIDETNYNAFRDWAGTVKVKGGSAAGAQGVMAADNAWVSYALGQNTLLETAPTDEDLAVETFEPAAESGKFDFTVSVKDIEVGSEATKENLKKVFGLEGAATLDGAAFSSDKVDIEFATPVDGNVRFTAGPKDTNAKMFFMKVKILP